MLEHPPKVVAVHGYGEVLAALEHPDLVVPGTTRATASGTLAESARSTLGPLDNDTLWESLRRSAQRLVDELRDDAAVDLIRDFAMPWSLELATHAARLPAAEATRASELARTIFLAAAHSSDGRINADSRDATMLLAIMLGAGGRASLDVQAFVALSQTLPCFLGAAWHALLAHPDQARWLAGRGVTSDAIDELLRFAGPSRAVFREAIADLRIGSSAIGAGDVVALMLAAANRDEAVFPNANRLDLSRRASRHLAFGHRPHACIGAAVTRTAAKIATRVLLPRLVDGSVVSIERIDGFAIRGPSSLVAALPRASQNS